MPNRASIDRRATENCARHPEPAAAKEGCPEVQWQVQNEKMPENCQVMHPEPVMLAAPLSVQSTITQQQTKQSYVLSSAPSSGDSTGISRHDSSLLLPAKDLPFKEECMRVVATFLKAGSPKELNLDAMIRDSIIRDLVHSTHPDVVSVQVIFPNSFKLNIVNRCAYSSCMRTRRRTTCLKRPAFPDSSRMLLPMSTYRNNYISA